MEESMEEREEVEAKRESNARFYVVLFLCLLAVVAGSVYYAFMLQRDSATSQAIAPSTIVPIQEGTPYANAELERLKLELASKQKQLERLSENLNEAKAPAANLKLAYAIKPKERVIAECYTMEVGKWELPENCVLSLAANVNSELEADKRVVAFEVQGIVDTTPYGGLSPELKQEGLASFRAREAIRAVEAKIPHAVVFEGLSIQESDRRGYRLKAYFVE